MKILITGSTGFVGRHLVPKLIERNYKILELTQRLEYSEELYGNNTEKYFITEKQEELVNCIETFNPEIVIHLASYLSSNDDFNTLNKLLNTNLFFFCRVLDALKNTDLKLLINTGTFAEYQNGNNVFDPAYLYAATKTASRSFVDYYSKIANYKQVTVVPYTIYGGNDTNKKIIDIIYDSIESQIPIDLSPGEQVLDFIHINDVIDFYLHIIDNSDKITDKTNFHLGTGIGHTLREVAQIIEETTKKKTNINWGAKAYRPTDVMCAVADLQILKITINWLPEFSLKKGIKKYINNNY